MGRASKRKGTRIELELVNRLKAAGFAASRVPLSGSLGGDLAGDVRLTLPNGTTLRAEAKGRASGDGFRTILRWLGDNDALFLRQDRTDPVVVLPWRVFLQLLGTPCLTSPTPAATRSESAIPSSCPA